MADMAEKIDDTIAQKEGSAVSTDEQGNINTYGGIDVPNDEGIAIMNTRWGDRINTEG